MFIFNCNCLVNDMRCVSLKGNIFILTPSLNQLLHYFGKFESSTWAALVSADFIFLGAQSAHVTFYGTYFIPFSDLRQNVSIFGKFMAKKQGVPILWNIRSINQSINLFAK